MFLSKSYTPSKSLQFLWLSKLSCSILLILMVLSFPIIAQEVEDELPAPFFGNWVEDLSECETGSYFSIANSELGLFVFGLGWSSHEVKVEKMGDYYMLYVDAISEGGDFQSEIKVKMGDDGNLFFIDSDSEEKELVKCDPTEFFEYESEETTLEEEGLEVEELDMGSSIDVEFMGNELPLPFYGNWVEDLSQCDGVPPFSIDYAMGSLLVSGPDWYSTEVKVTFKDDFYSLTIKGLSEEGEIETEIIIGMDEEENLIVSIDGGETGSKLVKCDLIENEEFVELQDEEMTLVDIVLDVEEFDVDNSLAMDTLNIELKINFPENNFDALLSRFRNKQKNVAEYNNWLSKIVTNDLNGDPTYVTANCLAYIGNVMDYYWGYEGSIDEKTLKEKWENQYDLKYSNFGHLFENGNCGWMTKKLTRIEYLGELNDGDWFKLTINGGCGMNDYSNTLIRIIKVVKEGNTFYIDNFLSLHEG